MISKVHPLAGLGQQGGRKVRPRPAYPHSWNHLRRAVSKSLVALFQSCPHVCGRTGVVQQRLYHLMSFRAIRHCHHRWQVTSIISYQYIKKESIYCRESTTHMHLGEKSSNICNIVFQEVIKNHHVSFFGEKCVVGQILDDFRYDHQTPTQYLGVFLWYVNTNCLR